MSYCREKKNRRCYTVQLFSPEQNISAALNSAMNTLLRECVLGTFPDFALSECTTEYAVATVPPATESMYHCVGLSQSSAPARITAQSRSALPRVGESRTTWQSWSLGGFGSMADHANQSKLESLEAPPTTCNCIDCSGLPHSAGGLSGN